MKQEPRGVSRRNFVGTGVAAAVAITTQGRYAAAPSTGDTVEPSQVPDFALDEVSIDELRTRMQGGVTTARAIAEQYLARIDALDKRGPAVNAVIELNPDALATAAQRDDERRAGRIRGPLHGIPVLIKDNIDTADRMKTSGGSLALADNVAAKDACVAERLRAAGAVILGKTNLSEWANFRSTHSSSGWSGRGGQTRNPYALDRTPSGSSSGSGTGAAANFCAVAIGTETDGSVTSPAAAAALVGIKPTVGLVGRSGIIPISHIQDTAGPMARTVRDVAILLGALTGVDPRDAATQASRGHALTDYTTALNRDGLRGARIGVVRKHFSGYHPATDKVFESAIDLMRQHGAIVVDPADIVTAGQFDDPEFEALQYEFKAGLDGYLRGTSNSVPVHSLADVIAFNNRTSVGEMQYFGQEIMEMSVKKAPLTDAKYLALRARIHRLAVTEGIDATMAKHRLDALVAPTQGPAWLIDPVNGDAGGIVSFTGPAAVSGYPHITVPMGFVRQLPIGLSIMGRAWSEAMLLKLAFAFEQAAPARRKPRFAPTADYS
jgi:amidase